MTNLERYYPGLRADAFKPTEGSMAVDPVTKNTISCSACKAFGSCKNSRAVTCWGAFLEWLEKEAE